MKLTFSLFVFSLLSIIAKAQSPCEPNIDFESGNFTNWYLYTGSCCPITLSPSAALPARHAITSGAAVDMYGGFPVVDPSAGIYSLKLGNNINGSQAEQARYYVHVPSGSNNYSLLYRYAVVFEDPGHPAAIQPRFEVKAFDSATGNPILCAQYSYVAASTLPGFVKSPISPQPIYKDWTTASVDLSSMNGKTVGISFSTGDCGAGAHFGYAYVDVKCALFETFGIDCLDGNLTTLTGPPGFQSYAWYNQSFTSFYGNGQTIQIATPPVTTTFAVVVTPFPGFGCSDTLFTTRKGSDLAVYAGRDTSVCVITGDKQVPLNAIATTSMQGLSYSWTPTTGLSCTTCSNPIATVSNTITYTVSVTDSSRCIRRDSIKITVAPTVFADLKADKDSICQYYDVWINNTLTNPAGNQFFWATDSAQVIQNDTINGKIKLRWGSPGLKTVTVRVFNKDCEIYDSVQVYIKPTPMSGFEMPLHGCINKPIELFPRNEDSWYYWTIDEKIITDTTYKDKILLSWATSGRKRAALELTGKNGCKSNIFEQSIIIHDNPNAVIEKPSSQKLCFGDKITLKANVNQEYYYDWEPAVYFDNNSYHEVVYSIKKSSTVTLNITDAYGCAGVDSVLVEGSMCCKVFLPDAFTPDGIGQNNKFKPVSIEYHKIHTFIIKNRWGQTVFETNNTNDAWDGTFNGKPQPVGTYMYYLKYICEDKETIERKGSVMLIR